MATLEEYARKRDVKGMIITALFTAMAFVVGLFWNDAIRSGIESVIPSQERVSAKFITAFIVTILAVFAGYALIRTYEFGEAAKRHLQQRVARLQEQQKRQAAVIARQRAIIRKKKGLF